MLRPQVWSKACKAAAKKAKADQAAKERLQSLTDAAGQVKTAVSEACQVRFPSVDADAPLRPKHYDARGPHCTLPLPHVTQVLGGALDAFRKLPSDAQAALQQLSADSVGARLWSWQPGHAAAGSVQAIASEQGTVMAALSCVAQVHARSAGSA